MMTLSLLTPVGFLIFCVACGVSSGHGEDAPEVIDRSDDVVSVDDDDFGLAREMTSLQKELRMGKRRFQQLWNNLKGRQPEEQASAFNNSMEIFHNHTRQIHDSLTRHLRSLNDFMTCLNSCTRTHSTDLYHSALEGSIRYFCNKSCLMAIETHHQLQVGASTQNPYPDTDEAIVG
ncbi:uncharacterized protein LOC143277917 [Babylonia areolata]|uniref:uncharacterized protein LOC143277917 n=1 Tax=Babylonia areolata TaxID=304850 RepID=UPI003FD0EE89